MIEGVKIIPLRKIPDERGCIYHMLRNDAEHFDKFGEIYFSTVYPGVVKAWHLHKRMTLNYAVVSGMIKLVLFDDREGSASRGETAEIFIGEQNYQLVQIPALIWNGFKGISDKMAIVANCASEPHDPQEIVRKEPNWAKIGYDWSRKDG